MQDSVFRKKNLDQISSPERLTDYMRVTNPPVWMMIVTILLLIVGVFVFSALTKLESKVPGLVISKNGSAVCYVSEKNRSRVAEGAKVYADGQTFTVLSLTNESAPAEGSLSAYAMQLGGYLSGEQVYALPLLEPLRDGSYSCEIVVEELSPISFLWNAQ